MLGSQKVADRHFARANGHHDANISSSSFLRFKKMQLIKSVRQTSVVSQPYSDCRIARKAQSYMLAANLGGRLCLKLLKLCRFRLTVPVRAMPLAQTSYFVCLSKVYEITRFLCSIPKAMSLRGIQVL